MILQKKKRKKKSVGYFSVPSSMWSPKSFLNAAIGAEDPLKRKEAKMTSSEFYSSKWWRIW
jgi:hypothetical protein